MEGGTTVKSNHYGRPKFSWMWNTLLTEMSKPDSEYMMDLLPPEFNLETDNLYDLVSQPLVSLTYTSCYQSPCFLSTYFKLQVVID